MIDKNEYLKLFCNFITLYIVEMIIKDFTDTTILEFQSEILFGKTNLPMYTVYDSNFPYEYNKSSVEFINEYKEKHSDEIPFIIDISKVNNHYCILLYLYDYKNDMYINCRSGTNQGDKRISYTLEGVKLQNKQLIYKKIEENIL
jgi:hypothetical protein